MVAAAMMVVAPMPVMVVPPMPSMVMVIAHVLRQRIGTRGLVDGYATDRRGVSPRDAGKPDAGCNQHGPEN